MKQAILEARRHLTGVAHITPVMTSSTLDRLVGAAVLIKCENFQRAGAFKFRGAYHAISRLTPEQRACGVVTYSSGNHAQAVALVGKLLGVSITVVMPDNAPRVKRQATEGYGAEVVAYNPAVDAREEICRRLCEQSGSVLIPPFDHLDIVAGQATATAELVEQVGPVDLLTVPCGGGGLLSGSALAARYFSPGCRTIGVEPETADDATRSFYSKTLQTVENPKTMADGTRTPCLGNLTFPLVLENVADMATVSEAAIAEAVRFLFFQMKLVAEPSGVLGLAALLTGAVKASGRVGVILSGGNVDAKTMMTILAGDNPSRGCQKPFRYR